MLVMSKHLSPPSLVAQMVKRLAAVWETQVQFLVWEDPLEKAMATHSSTLAWKIPWTEEPGRLQSMGSLRVRHDWMTSLSSFALLVQFSSAAQSCLTLRLHGLQHSRTPCPSPSPRACSNSCPTSWWYHQTILSSVIPFSSCIQSFPVSRSFQMSQLFASGGQNIGASALASVLPMYIQLWSPLGWTVLISLQSKGLSKVFSDTTVPKHQFFGAQLSSQSNSHIHTWLLEKL